MGKTKYKYKSKEFLDSVEALAKKGLTDREIAFSFQLSPTYFSGKKSAVPELSEALTRARSTLNSVVRQKYLAIGLGGIKTKTVTKKAVESEDGKLSAFKVIHEQETELAPNPNVLATWLFNHDEEWRKSVIDGKKLDVTSNGKEIGVQLVFSNTHLSEKDIEEIKRISDGGETEENSENSGLSETGGSLPSEEL